MYRRDSTLISYIDDSIRTYIEIKIRRGYVPTEEEKITLSKFHGPNKYDAYFEHMKKPGQFGTIAEIYAFSKIFEVAVHVQVQTEGRIREGFWPAFNADAPRSITLIHQDGDHFNWQDQSRSSTDTTLAACLPT